MKILQINVWQGRLLKPLLNMVSSERPDIIFTQEIYSYADEVSPASSWNYFRTLEFLAEAGGLQHNFFSPCTTFTMFGEKLSFGNAILSKFPLDGATTHYTGGPGPVHIHTPARFDSNLTRNFQHAVATTPSGSLHLINQHAIGQTGQRAIRSLWSAPAKLPPTPLL